MLNVFFTVDVEVWCQEWNRLDVEFPDAFRRYIYGPTRRGHFGLQFQARVLGDHGLPGVFFVEPLFSLRFGEGPLSEIVGLIGSGLHEIQLHLHTEWVDESREPVVAHAGRKRQFMFDFSLQEQRRLIEVGCSLLSRAGTAPVRAFRAGSFGFNLDTLRALASLGIPFDSSYNASLLRPESEMPAEEILVDPTSREGVIEHPMTVFNDGIGRLRHTQLTACSATEIEGLLWQALHEGRTDFMILSHNFELLTRSRTAADPVMVSRFRRLCAFLDRHRDVFRVRGFRDLQPAASGPRHRPLRSSWWQTALRCAVQTYRRRFA
jgi:hypothetical protein